MEKNLSQLTKITEAQDKQIRELKTVITKLHRHAAKQESVVKRLHHTVRNLTNNMNVVLKKLRSE